MFCLLGKIGNCKTPMLEITQLLISVKKRLNFTTNTNESNLPDTEYLKELKVTLSEFPETYSEATS